jgi:hypothetical protein
MFSPCVDVANVWGSVRLCRRRQMVVQGQVVGVVPAAALPVTSALRSPPAHELKMRHGPGACSSSSTRSDASLQILQDTVVLTQAWYRDNPLDNSRRGRDRPQQRSKRSLLSLLVELSEIACHGVAARRISWLRRCACSSTRWRGRGLFSGVCSICCVGLHRAPFGHGRSTN